MNAHFFHQHNPYQETVVTSEKRGKADREASRLFVWRMVGLTTCVASGALTAGGLAALIYGGFSVVLAAIFGGVCGMFTAACCQVAGAGSID